MDLEEFATQVPLKHTIRKTNGGEKEITVTFGTKQRRIPFNVKALVLAHEKFVSDSKPEVLAAMSITEFRKHVMAIYKQLTTTAAGLRIMGRLSAGYDPQPLKPQKLRKAIRENEFPGEQDMSMQPKDFTIIDTTINTGQTALILGASFTGKTTFLVAGLKNIVKEKSYDVEVLFTESINADPLKKLPKEVTVANGFFPEVVRLAFKINRATENRYRFLFVLDDVITVRNNQIFEKMVLTMRNSNISTVILTQDPMLIRPGQRNSFHNIYVTGGGNSNQRKEFIVKNWLGGYAMNRGVEKKDLIQWLDDNTRVKDSDGKPGKFIWLQSIRDHMSVQQRPKI